MRLTRLLTRHTSPDNRDCHSFPTRRSSDLNLSGNLEPANSRCSSPISHVWKPSSVFPSPFSETDRPLRRLDLLVLGILWLEDRKSTRMKFSHVRFSYAVFCL